jgi:hypothetical protein
MKSKLNKEEISELHDQAAGEIESERVNASVEEQPDLIQQFFYSRMNELRIFLWLVLISNFFM